MRACVLRGPRDVLVEERPVPTPGPGEVLVEIASVGACGSDTHFYEHGRIGQVEVRYPRVLGHEASGRIVAVGGGVDPERIGERVAVEPGTPCRRCESCKAGRYNVCLDVMFLGSARVDGAFCEYIAVAADFAHAIPSSISDDAAGLLEPLSVGIWAIAKGRVGLGGSLLVSGAGPIGLLVTQLARAAGSTRIIVTDIDPHRLALAAELGATEVHTPDEVAAGSVSSVESFIECSGAPQALVTGLRMISPGGRAVLVGMGADEVSLPVSVIQRREIEMIGAFRYTNTWPAAIALASSGRIELDRMVTGRVGLESVGDALVPDPTAHHIKVVVRPRGHTV